MNSVTYRVMKSSDEMWGTGSTSQSFLAGGLV